jgi:RNA polymerase sigma-70 factor, ECF subfamily
MTRDNGLGGRQVKLPVDRELVDKAVGGCARAFASLLAAHYDEIYRMAWRWLGSRPEAEDVTQDVCVKLATAIRGYRGEAGFSTWLYRVTYSAVTDHIRSRERVRRMEGPEVVALFQGGSGRSPDEGVIDGELWDEVRRLPPQQRDAVLLVYGQDMSHGEAAAVMGCTEKTVSWHVHAARRSLRARLEAVG